MNLSALTALSPLDGRYAAKARPLRALLSEFGLMHRRVQVEVEWFIALSDAGFAELAPLSQAARGLLRGLVVRFSEADAQAIKDIERTTNHDVKAVEYWLKSRFDGQPELRAAGEFVHFRVYQRRHQQRQPRTDVEGRARAGAAARARWPGGYARRDGTPVRRGTDAVAHARPDGEPDHRRQGTRQRRRAVGDGAHAHRRGAAAGQDERRRRQFQRPPRGLPGIRLAGDLRAAWSSSSWA